MNETHRKVLAVSIFIIMGISLFSSSASAGLLSDFFDKIREWFESSPFGNLFARPVKRMTEIDLTFYPKSFVFKPESMVNLTTDSTRILNFNGEIELDLEKGLAILRESNSQLRIEEKIETMEIQGLSLGSLELRNMKLTMISGNWTETTESGSLKMYDFLGKALLKPDSIELIGNVSKVVKE